MGPRGSHFPRQAPSALVGSGTPGQTQGAQHSLWSEKEGPPGTEEVGSPLRLSRSALWTLWVGNRLLEAPVSSPHPSGHSRRLSGRPASSGVSPLTGSGVGRAPASEQGCGPLGAWIRPPVHHANSGTREEALQTLTLPRCGWSPVPPRGTPTPRWERAEQTARSPCLMKLCHPRPPGQRSAQPGLRGA